MELREVVSHRFLPFYPSSFLLPEDQLYFLLFPLQFLYYLLPPKWRLYRSFYFWLTTDTCWNCLPRTSSPHHPEFVYTPHLSSTPVLQSCKSVETSLQINFVLHRSIRTLDIDLPLHPGLPKQNDNKISFSDPKQIFGHVFLDAFFFSNLYICSLPYYKSTTTLLPSLTLIRIRLPDRKPSSSPWWNHTVQVSSFLTSVKPSNIHYGPSSHWKVVYWRQRKPFTSTLLDLSRTSPLIMTSKLLNSSRPNHSP